MIDEDPVIGGAREARAGSFRSTRKARIAAAILAVAAAFALFDGGLWLLRGTDGTSAETSASTGSQVPAVSGIDLGGRRVTVSSLEGRPAVVTFFGSWCGPCRREAAVFPTVARKFGVRVSILAVAVSDTVPHDRRFAHRYDWTWPVVEDSGFGWSMAFGLMGVPGTYVLDARGHIVDRVFGSVTVPALTADLGRLMSNA